MLFTETPDGLAYQEPPWPVGIRLLFVAFGAAIAVAVPYPFWLHAQWQVMSWTTALAAACVVVPVLLGLAFIGVGVAGATGVRFDRDRREVRVAVRRPWGVRHRTVGFAQVERVEVQRNTVREGPDVFELVLRIRGRRRLLLGVWDSAAEAAHWQQRVQAALAV